MVGAVIGDPARGFGVDAEGQARIAFAGIDVGKRRGQDGAVEAETVEGAAYRAARAEVDLAVVEWNHLAALPQFGEQAGAESAGADEQYALWAWGIG